MKTNSYLRAGRLEDILFLIQYLGLGKNYSLERDSKPDGVAARSSSDGLWATVARDHPEFFRVTDKDSVVLAMRYYQRDGTGRPPTTHYRSRSAIGGECNRIARAAGQTLGALEGLGDVHRSTGGGAGRHRATFPGAQVMANQPLHLTAAALRLFEVQRLTSRRGR